MKYQLGQTTRLRRSLARVTVIVAMLLALVVALQYLPSVTKGTTTLAAPTTESPAAAATSAAEPRRYATLAEAAAQPSGNSAQTDRPAKNLDTNGDRHSSQDADHKMAVNDSQQTGVSSGGCYIDYGKPGVECLSVAVAGTVGGKPSCQIVRKTFPAGISVTGTDRLALDSNHDGVACGKGDA